MDWVRIPPDGKLKLMQTVDCRVDTARKFLADFAVLYVTDDACKAHVT